MNQEYLEKLALLAVEGGVNVKPDQVVVINADICTAPLVREMVKKAYEKGAREVLVRWSDEVISREHWLHADESVFESLPAWQAAQLNDTAKEGACYIHVTSEDPDLMQDVNPSRISKRHIAQSRDAHVYRAGIDGGDNAWTIVAWPSVSWAKKVYPDLSDEKAVEALAADIFAISRIDEKDPLENWKKHNDSFQNRVRKLNSLNLKSLHYQNEAGTDLWVELPVGYIFAGGGTLMKDGTYTYPNIPTEEIFAAPHRLGTRGHLVSTMPLNLDGNLIEGLWFDFEDGKVVNFGADTNKEVMEEMLKSDEGAKYLGEAALVPWGSPIQALNRIYYNTLIDENASCHFALGKAYAECIENGLNLSKEERLEKGLNDSMIHIDFMVGSEDLSITGLTRDGKEVPVFEDGKFSQFFDEIE